MTVADVWKDRIECFLEERDVVALADGQFDGYGYDWIIQRRLHQGKYLGCSDLEYMLVMTDIDGSHPNYDWTTCEKRQL